MKEKLIVWSVAAWMCCALVIWCGSMAVKVHRLRAQVAAQEKQLRELAKVK